MYRVSMSSYIRVGDLDQPMYAIYVPLASISHPLVYNSTPHPQWSSGYDFRVSIEFRSLNS